MLTEDEIKKFKEQQPLSVPVGYEGPFSHNFQPKYLSIEDGKEGITVKGIHGKLVHLSLDDLQVLIKHYFTDIKL